MGLTGWPGLPLPQLASSASQSPPCTSSGSQGRKAQMAHSSLGMNVREEQG